MRLSLFVSALFTYSGLFRIDVHAAFAAPDEDENSPPHPHPLPPQSFFVGEGEDEYLYIKDYWY
ncbi:MAG: hypothetical protein GX428_01100 [Candidatus Atribacteria bacterium]|nr:hypothetical protein [Candidatus Atribacteria bacterium]